MSQISFSDIVSNRGGSLTFRFPGDWMSHSCQTEGSQNVYTYSTTPHGYMGWLDASGDLYCSNSNFLACDWSSVK